MSKENLKEVEYKINKLLASYEFPKGVVDDVKHRMESYEDTMYWEQQKRYLDNLIKHGYAKKRG